MFEKRIWNRSLSIAKPRMVGTGALYCLVALLGIVNAASADPLPAGGALFDPRVPALTPNYTTTTPFSPGVTTGYSLLISTDFAYTGGFAGKVTSEIWKKITDGTLLFDYVFNNTSATSNEIANATIGDPSHPWAGVSITDAGADKSGSSTAVGTFSWTDGNPAELSRQSVANGSGLSIDFPLLKTLGGTELLSPSDKSAIIWFKTGAKSYKVTDVGLLDSGTSGASHAYAPAVPEPSRIIGSIGCLATMMGLAVFWPRRRRSVSV
jgi:hypothetical protein